jgi:hypothetical protein
MQSMIVPASFAVTPEGNDCGDGMFCLKVDSADEAAEIAAQNPFHQRGVRMYTVKPWLQRMLD